MPSTACLNPVAEGDVVVSLPVNNEPQEATLAWKVRSLRTARPRSGDASSTALLGARRPHAAAQARPARGTGCVRGVPRRAALCTRQRRSKAQLVAPAQRPSVATRA